MKKLTEQLENNEDLNLDQIAEATDGLLNARVKVDTKGAFLTALAKKGETPAEITGFVNAFLEHAVDPGIKGLRKPVIDICGTGGDKMNFFNVSTTCIFPLAAAGVYVVKHGNRGITSKSGGADVLEALGIDIEMGPDKVADCVKSVGACFLFAPAYHPAFKAVVNVRKKLAEEGQRTIFNILGPLLNPARPKHQLVGVFDKKLGPTFAEIMENLGRKSAWAVHGTTADGKGVDEFSTLDETFVWATDRKPFAVDSSVLGLKVPETKDLKGGDAKKNAKILTEILDGTDEGPKRDIVLLNTSAALTITGKATDLRDGLEKARELI
ncbi:MAG: anthranilate phosphoribosyltransferase, partial [Verrucomicrobiota bacterium]